ncbi:MAG: hypothetical protein ACI83N_001648 [Hydrogenophaga sp.]|jgi:hypothetical protein
MFAMDAMLGRCLHHLKMPRPDAYPASVQLLADHARRQLTGVLAFDHRAFVQCLEGEREAVSEVFCRIAADARHRRIVLLEWQPVDERLFASWGMGFAAADATGREAFLRFGCAASFDPHAMSAGAALGLLRALESRIRWPGWVRDVRHKTHRHNKGRMGGLWFNGAWVGADAIR